MKGGFLNYLDGIRSLSNYPIVAAFKFTGFMNHTGHMLPVKILGRLMHMQSTNTASNKVTHWRLRDVILLALVGIFFGFIFWAWAFVYNVVAATPLKPFANDITIGAWVMAGPMAGFLLRKAGASLLGEILAAAAEMMMGSQWGVSNLLSGFIQGIGAELGFAITGYKRWDAFGLFLSTLMTTIITFGWDLFANGYASYHFGLLIALFIIRFLSIGFFGGILVNAITKLIDKSGVLAR